MTEQEFMRELNADCETEYPAWFIKGQKVIGFKVGEKIEIQISEDYPEET